MPSNSSTAPARTKSLVRRVGWTSALIALAASATSLVVAFLVVDERVIAEAEEDLDSRAQAFVEELALEGDAREGERERLLDEIAEFEHGGVSIAVDRDGQTIGAALPAQSEGCATREDASGEWLVCAARSDASVYRVRMGEPRAQILTHRLPLMWGGLIALLVVGLGGVIAGYAVARWSMGPLVRLREAVAAVTPGSSATLPRSGLVEIDEVAETLADALLRLERELLRSRRFAADAAHELRTPLTKLRMDLELMAEEVSSERVVATVQRTVQRTEDLSLLVERLLMLASPGDALRGDTLVSLAATVETVVGDLLEAERVVFDDASDGLVPGDATILAAVVSNAMGNALKFSDGIVRVSVSDEDSFVLLRVDDEGPGVRPEDRERAFEDFFRAPEHRSAPGHGVGLALIAHVVDAHGGTARFVDGSPGAHLEIRLPRHAR